MSTSSFERNIIGFIEQPPITSEVVTITPAVAKMCLERNPANRRLNASMVEHYAKMMLSGEWLLTHQGIAFDDCGNLLDGQHRLSAIILADIPVKMQVSRGLKRETILGVDAGLKRSFDDRSKFLGRDYNTKQLAVARIMKIGPKTQSNWRRMTPAEQFAIVDEYREGVEFALSVPNKSGSKWIPSPVRAIIARASYTQDNNRLAEFARVLHTGEMSTPEDQAAIKLRDLMVAMHEGGISTTNNLEFYYKAEAALVAFLKRRRLQSLCSVGSEQFTLKWEAKQ